MSSRSNILPAKNFAGRAARTVGVCALVGLLLVGCDSKSSSTPKRGPSFKSNSQGGLFDSVAENLDRLEEFDTGQMLKQICDRLNQWQLQDKPRVEWKEDPLVETLPANLTPVLRAASLDDNEFRLPDAWYLQESVWLRNISKRARSDQFQDVAVAERLFDWTIRNLQLEPDFDPSKPIGGKTQVTLRHQPFQTLLMGRADMQERALIFMRLCAQQGIDTVFLGVGSKTGTKVQPWLPAVLSEGRLYLFDIRLGLPIPGPGGKGVATLEEVVADPGLLRKMDVDAEHPYPVGEDELKRIVAYIDGSPISLSRRMTLVESRLAGARKMRLSSPGNVLAEKVRSLPGISQVKLWPLAFETFAWQSTLDPAGQQAVAREMLLFQTMANLRTGRALQFKGQIDGDPGAKRSYLESHPSDRQIDAYKLPKSVARNMKQEDIFREEASRIIIMRQAKQNATYWLGVIAFEEGDYPNAIYFFGDRVLEVAPDGPWASGARYNLGRSYEAEGNLDRAIATYQGGTSPQSDGNQVRARWLKEKQHPAEAKAAEVQPETKPANSETKPAETVPSESSPPAAEKADASPPAEGAPADNPPKY